MASPNVQSRRTLLPLIILSSIILVIGIAVFFLFFEGDAPELRIDSPGEYLGKKATISYSAFDKKSGLRQVTITATQGNTSKIVHTLSFPRNNFIGMIGQAETSNTLAFETKKEGFVDGPLTLKFEVSDYSLRGWLQGNKTVVSREVTVQTVPPQVRLLQNDKYISPGGAGIAIYRLSTEKCKSGVKINGITHPGFLVGDGRTDIYITYFALPYDAQKIDSAQVFAVDPAGNETIVPFSITFKNAVQKHDSINISDNFLKTKMPEVQKYYPELTGELIDQYLYTNNTIRDLNNKKIFELCQNPSTTRFWKGSFLRMAGSPMAGYADHRDYLYGGKVVDRQVHLGVDIASTNRAEVRAANKGKVVFADYLGIYGNMILLDHGQGVFSLYSHLSQINVAVGNEVEKKSTIGLTGTTGMAGGDHLHFSMLINGVFVMPKEWWDDHWIEVTIESPLGLSKS